jgi:hypothetical protein
MIYWIVDMYVPTYGDIVYVCKRCYSVLNACNDS